MSLQTANSCTETPPPYGKTNYELNLGVSVNTLYTGQQFDREAALYYYNARYYDPQLGRFIQPDTLIPGAADSQAYNRYTYCRNNPIMFTDPTGHSWLSKAWNKVQETVVKAVPNEAKPVISAVASAVTTFYFGNEAGGAIGGLYSAYLNGASIQDTLFSTGIGAASGSMGRIPGVGHVIGGSFSGWAFADYYGGDRQKSARDGAKIGTITQGLSWAAGKFYNGDGLVRDIARGAASGMASGAASAAINDEDIGKAMLQGAAIGAVTTYALNQLPNKNNGPAFEPSEWNDGADIQNSTNCYSYARNDKGPYPRGFKLQPGDLSGNPMSSVTVDSVRRAAIADGLKTSLAPGEKGYAVDFVVGNITVNGQPAGQDYHWYRQDSNGTWSHKPGHGEAVNVDASRNPITDPRTADRNYFYNGGAVNVNYDQYGGRLWVPIK